MDLRGESEQVELEVEGATSKKSKSWTTNNKMTPWTCKGKGQEELDHVQQDDAMDLQGEGCEGLTAEQDQLVVVLLVPSPWGLWLQKLTQGQHRRAGARTTR